MSQTSYPTTQGVPYAGLLADIHTATIRSFTNREASAKMAFGVFVTRNSTEGDGAKLLAAAGDTVKLMGITVHRHSVNTIGASAWATNDGIPAGDRFDLLQRGLAWVRCETAISVTDSLLVRWQANGGNTTIGALRAGADTGAAATTLGGLRVVEPSTGAGVVLVEFDLMAFISQANVGFTAALPKF